jgi:hypothetical protein
MRDRLAEFSRQVSFARFDKESERIVRCILEEVAKDCPLPLILELAGVVIDYRKRELRIEAEQN